MRNAGWYGETFAPGERTKEEDAYGCAHCQAISFVRPGFGKPLQVAMVKRDGSVTMVDAPFCRNCYQYICPRCEGKPCVPKEKMIEEMEKAARKVIWS